MFTFWIGNLTQSPTPDKTTEILGMTATVLSVFSFIMFFLFGGVIVHAYVTTPRLRDTARYVLFIHMLFNDTLYLLITFFLFICALLTKLYTIMPLCFVIISLAAAAYRITPYNLAIMSVERYVAICAPLRHSKICSVHWCHCMIALMWALGLAPAAIDFILMSFSVDESFYSSHLRCNFISYLKNDVQSTVRSLVQMVSFGAVGLVILYTYVKVMLVVWNIQSADKSSATKAGRTVLLHAFQLFLCMTSFSSTFTDLYLRNNYPFIPTVNYFFFTCIPRFISPLIYGARDEVFLKYLHDLRTYICSKRQVLGD